jgi:protein disulfide-isomerase
MAKAVGLDYRFDKAVIANSFDAHRLVQMAKQQGLGDAAEEHVFRAYFTEGQDTGNPEVLAQLGAEIGLEKTAVATMLASTAFADAVRAEVAEAQEIGVTGVPFFVLDRKYAISGAQEPQVFTQALQQAFAEWKKANPLKPLQTTTGQVCTPTGCD